MITTYQRILLAAVAKRFFVVLLVAFGIFAMNKAQDSILPGIVALMLLVIGGAQIFQIINYLSMSKLELIRQIKWERTQ